MRFAFLHAFPRPGAATRPVKVRPPGAFWKSQKPGRDARRARLLFLTVSLGFLVMAGRLVDISLGEAAMGEPGPVQRPVPALRADIVDRHGQLLARDLSLPDVVADASRIARPVETAQRLTAVFPDLNVDAVARRLAGGDPYVVIARRVSPETAQAAFELGLAGIWVKEQARRIYPQGRLAAHLLGHVNADGQGSGGIEEAFDRRLRSEPDEPLKLTLDVRVQAELEDVLELGQALYRAEAASGVILDAWTGDVLAVASMPDFDPHHPGAAGDAAQRHRALADRLELGSVFKLFSVAAALDTQLVAPSTRVDLPRVLTVGGHTIEDFHTHDEPTISVADILVESSNVGAAVLAEIIGAEALVGYYASLGLFDAVPARLPELAQPQVPDRFGPAERATMSFGHGLAVTPLHAAAAAAAVLTDGVYQAPRFVMAEGETRLRGQRAVETGTALTMRALARRVVTEGSGGHAAVPALAMLGKTGTADKADRGGYDTSRRVASFLAAYPGDRPQVVSLIVLDEPQPVHGRHPYATAGWNAAPLSKLLAIRVAAVLGLDAEAEARPAPMTAQAGG